MDLMGPGQLFLRTTCQCQPWGVSSKAWSLWGHWPTTPHPTPCQGLTPGRGEGVGSLSFLGSGGAERMTSPRGCPKPVQLDRRPERDTQRGQTLAYAQGESEGGGLMGASPGSGKWHRGEGQKAKKVGLVRVGVREVRGHKVRGGEV